MKLYNPTTGQVSGQAATLSDSALAMALVQGQQAAHSMAKTTLAERSQWLVQVAQGLRDRQRPLAELMAVEMGKPIKEGLAEVEKAAWCAEHYASHAGDYLKPVPLASDAHYSGIRYQPLGLILGILPWNAPVWLALRFAAPCLMAGNACLMKHDAHVPGCAGMLQEIFDAVAAPKAWLQRLDASHEQVATAIGDRRVKGVSLTGSDRAGSKVAALAGAAIKPVVLELGGSDVAIVLADADLEKAARVIALSRTINAGQSCIAAKRIIVMDAQFDRFQELLLTHLAAIRQGDPLLESTDMGPLARADLREQLHRQVEQSLAQGAKLGLGGVLPDGPGYFYPVTLLTEVSNDMVCAQEETFGPVAVLMRAQSPEQAVAMANDSAFGLGAAIWGDTQQALALAEDLQTGQVAINGIVKTDPRLPSGGVKRSGLGRELGPQGIQAFTNVQQIWQA